MEGTTPGFVTLEMTRLLDEKYQEWLAAREQRKRECPDESGDTYGLLLYLITAILEGPDPDHLVSMEKYLRLIHSDRIEEKRRSLEVV